jgi:hypothetical protein
VRELEQALGDRTDRVTVFREIAEIAHSRGLRVYLFGGSAASFVHYVKWDLLREHGDRTFVPERFDYHFGSIYRSNQDADLVIARVDGGAETTRDIAGFQQAVEERFPFMREDKLLWVVRGLRTAAPGQMALLGDRDFAEQNTDSQSTGLVELTKPPASEQGRVVRDVRDWDSRSPRFLRDAASDVISFYESKNHFNTARAAKGDNPEIFGAIRYLTKAFQFGLEMDPESRTAVTRIVRAFDPRRVRRGYVENWIEKNGKKLFQNAVDIETAWRTLAELGLRQKLAAMRDNPREVPYHPGVSGVRIHHAFAAGPPQSLHLAGWF